VFVDELDLGALVGQGSNDPPQVIEVASQPVHTVHDNVSPLRA
jgi:hypothetical protein